MRQSLFDRTTTTSSTRHTTQATSMTVSSSTTNNHKSSLATAINVVAFITIIGGFIGGIVAGNQYYRFDFGALLVCTVASVCAALPMFGLARCVRAADKYLNEKTER